MKANTTASRWFLPAILLVAGAPLASALTAEQIAKRETLFLEVFGEKARFAPERVAQVKALEPGERLWIDSDGDGRVDEVWFIDTDSRHVIAGHHPILVRAVDEDGDLREGLEPDLDSDIYFADWQADGVVDVVLDYTDLDGDNDVDEMAFFFYRPRDPYFGEDTLCAWWGHDLGDDNLLWHDVGFGYSQRHCQWRCHFGGDEIFNHYALQHAPLRWVPTWENPFIFWDHDGDGESEEVVRFSGIGDRVENIRWSMDADNDSSSRNPHDYDFSLTAWARGCRWQSGGRRDRAELRFGPSVSESTTLRGIPTERYLSPDSGRHWARRQVWERILLTWDEIDYNCEGRMAADPHERWEGVIAHGNDRFPQVGGPSCGPLNKRNEIVMKPGSRLELYWSPIDRRIHLRGASDGWLDVDYDLDGKKDMAYAWRDTDGDGVFDHWEIDLDADGGIDVSWDGIGDASTVDPAPLEYGELQRSYNARLDEALAENKQLIDALKAVLAAREENFRVDAIEEFYVERLDGVLPQAGVGAKLRRSPETARFYQDLIRDRYLARLEGLGDPDAWERIAALRRQGAYGWMANRVREAYLPEKERNRPAPGHAALAHLPRSVVLDVSNPSDRPAEGVGVEVAIDAIRSVARDFNPQGCIVTAPGEWIAARIIPSQIAGSEAGDGRGELAFLADCPARASVAYTLHYHPEGATAHRFPHRTAAADEWLPANIAWESDRVAYRSHWGQFDFFGKKGRNLIYPNVKGDQYVGEQDWGMDVLPVGETPGLGGLTLYVDGQPYPVRSPHGEGDVKFEKRIVEEGPVRSTVEVVASNVGPKPHPYTVRFRARALAGRVESPIDVLVTGGPPGGGPNGDPHLELGVGLRRLAVDDVILDSAGGCCAVWALPSVAIGRIGMGLVFEPSRFVRLDELPDERVVVLQIARDEAARHLIAGDWQRGRRFDRCPTIENWHRELRALATTFRRPLAVEPRRPNPAP